MNVIFIGGPKDCHEEFVDDSLCEEGKLYLFIEGMHGVSRVYKYRLTMRRMTETGPIYFEAHYIGEKVTDGLHVKARQDEKNKDVAKEG